MVKLSIEVDTETHDELLRRQLDVRLKEGKKKAIAQVAADALNEYLVKTKKPAK